MAARSSRQRSRAAQQRRRILSLDARRHTGANSSITIEAYIYWAGGIGREFAAALVERATMTREAWIRRGAWMRAQELADDHRRASTWRRRRWLLGRRRAVTQNGLDGLEIDRLDEVMIEPGVLRMLSIRFLPVPGDGEQSDTVQLR